MSSPAVASPGAVCLVLDQLATLFGKGEPLVLDPDDLPAVEGEVAAEDESLGVAAGGPVEGLGHRGPPVHHQRLVVGTVDGQATDVEVSVPDPPCAPLVVGVVRSPAPAANRSSARRSVPGLRCPAARAGPGWSARSRPARCGLEGPALAEVEHSLEHRVGIPAHRVEPRIGEVDERLLGLQLRCQPPTSCRPVPAPHGPRTAQGNPRLYAPSRSSCRGRRAPGPAILLS